MTTKNKVGRPTVKTLKANTTIRLYPKDRAKLEKKFGKLQLAIDFLVNGYLADTKGVTNAIQKQTEPIK